MAGRNNSRHQLYTPEEVYKQYISLVEPRIEEIYMWLYEGKTFSEIANELGVSNSLLWAMRTSKNFTDLRKVFSSTEIKKLKDSNVEDALYRKAIGYFVEEETPIKVKREYFNKMGKKCTKEEVQVVNVKKYIPADFNAQRFFLLNSMPGQYHSENAKPEDNSVELMAQNVDNILVKIKEAAYSSVPSTDEDEEE